MVQVFLPMGYPQLSGEELDHVIYQGTIVRFYSVPKDPRSGAQLASRRFLSDVVKMRAMLGTFARAACKGVFGKKWSTIVYQLVRADINHWWTDAVIEWQGFSETFKEEWRTAAPFRACYNDLGLIYFGLTRVIYRALLSYSNTTWDSAEWAENECDLASAWWSRDLTGVFLKGTVDSALAGLPYVGSWATETDAGAYLGSYNVTASSGVAYLELYVMAKQIDFYFTRRPDAGSQNIYINGRALQVFDQYAGSTQYQQTINLYTDVKRLNCVRLERWYGVLTFDYLSVL